LSGGDINTAKDIVMKNKIKILGIIALVAIIGFSMAACSNGSTGGGGGSKTTAASSITYTGKSADGSSYTLKITENTGRAAYTPKKGDSYELTVSGKKSTGSVETFSGGAFTLKPSNSDTTFKASISGSDLTELSGTITWTDKQEITGPGKLTPNNITGNLGNCWFGFEEDGVTTNYGLACWTLTGTNLTTAKTPGAKLVFVLSTAPSMVTQFAWANPDTKDWWNATNIFYDGSFISAVTWNSGTKTLTIPLSAAENYSSFITQSALILMIQHHGGNINDLGIVSANLVGP
jgi:hypothetical protein